MARAKSATVDLKLRLKEPLRAQIEKAAKSRGVSLNAEMVRRLETSFEKEISQSEIVAEAVGGLYASFGSITTFQIVHLLSDAITTVESVKRKKWTEDPATFKEVRKAADTILCIFAPSKEKKVRFTEEMASLMLIESESKRIGADAAKQAVGTWLGRLNLVKALRAGSKSK